MYIFLKTISKCHSFLFRQTLLSVIVFDVRQQSSILFNNLTFLKIGLKNVFDFVSAGEWNDEKSTQSFLKTEILVLISFQ